MMRICEECNEEKEDSLFHGKESKVCRKCKKAQEKQKGEISQEPLKQEVLEKTPEEREDTNFEKLVAIAKADPDYFNDLELSTYEDYVSHNALVGKLRRRVRKNKTDKKSPIQMRYCPIEKVPKVKFNISRTKNRGKHISLSFRKPKEAIYFNEQVDDGKNIELPEPLVPYIMALKEPIYKEIKNSDGTSETVIDYYNHKFNLNPWQ